MAIVQIYGMPQSNYVCTARIACAEKGVSCELVPGRPHSGEIAAIHPDGKMPVMRHGDVALFETKAICAYVDRAFDGPALQPTDPLGFAQVEQWVSFINASVQPVVLNEYAQSYFFRRLPDGSPNRPAIEKALPNMERHLGVLDKAVARSGHLVGDSYTIADMFLLPMTFYLKKLPESAAMMAALPALSAWHERHAGRRSFLDAVPPPMPGA